MHFHSDYDQAHWVGDDFHDCSLHMFVDASFADGFENVNSSTGDQLYLLGPRTFVTLLLDL